MRSTAPTRPAPSTNGTSKQAHGDHGSKARKDQCADRRGNPRIPRLRPAADDDPVRRLGRRAALRTRRSLGKAEQRVVAPEALRFRRCRVDDGVHDENVAHRRMPRRVPCRQWRRGDENTAARRDAATPSRRPAGRDVDTDPGSSRVPRTPAEPTVREAPARSERPGWCCRAGCASSTRTTT
jgi:hypothetical protein